MHKSRLGVIVIDCKTENLSEAAAFWGAALGGEARIDKDGKYASVTDQGEILVLVQAVDHAPRVHLDIETDNQSAECARLEALGAKKVAEIKRWIVMEAPTGHRFCIVNPQSDAFGRGAKTWEGAS